MKAMAGLDQQIARSGLEKSLVELVRFRASQLNGCAYCIDVHTADARKAGEGERRLATVALWRETSFFNDRERAALAWAESVTRVAETRVPDDVWERVKPHFTPAELVDLTCASTPSPPGIDSPLRFASCRPEVSYICFWLAQLREHHGVTARECLQNRRMTCMQ